MFNAFLCGVGLLISGQAASRTQNVYVSPPLSWLYGQRIHWDLRSTNYTVEALIDDKVYGNRYIEFKLHSKGSQEIYTGQFNFWSTNRLKTLEILKGAALRDRNRGHVVQLHEMKYISCIVPCRGTEYSLYLQIHRSGKNIDAKTEKELRHLLTKVSLTGRFNDRNK